MLEDKERQEIPRRRGNRPDGERESIWSVPQRLRGWYAGIFVAQYLLFLGLTIWDEVFQQTGDNWIQTLLAIWRGMSGNLLHIAGSAYAILEVYMLAEWLRERDRRREQEAIERAEAEAREKAETALQEAQENLETALEEARREARQRALWEARRQDRREARRWRAWYQRQQAAFREGRPFDEPPPGGPLDENGARDP